MPMWTIWSIAPESFISTPSGPHRGRMLFAAGPAQALDFEWRDYQFKLKEALSVGAAMRMQERSNELIGKLNVPGQQSLCQKDDCLSLEGDPGPNQRLV